MGPEMAPRTGGGRRAQRAQDDRPKGWRVKWSPNGTQNAGPNGIEKKFEMETKIECKNEQNRDTNRLQTTLPNFD